MCKFLLLALFVAGCTPSVAAPVSEPSFEEDWRTYISQQCGVIEENRRRDPNDHPPRAWTAVCVRKSVRQLRACWKFDPGSKEAMACEQEHFSPRDLLDDGA